MGKLTLIALLAIAGISAMPGSAVSAVGPVEGGGRELTTFAETRLVELPRDHRVPTPLRLEFTSSSTRGTAVPDLTGISVELSRNLALLGDSVPAGSVVGHGYVVSELVPPDQDSRSVAGPMRLILTRAAGVPRLLGEVRTSSVEYTIPFSIEPAHGAYETKLVVRRMRRIVGKCVAEHPNCLGSPYTLSGVYGRISRLQVTLGGNFVRASCSAPAGAVEWRFPLARFELRYNGGGTLRQAVNRGCRVAP